jgi:hypothetical protein
VTDQAVPRPASAPPTWAERLSDAVFIEWSCPSCGSVVAESGLGGQPTHMETELRYGAIRRPDADEDGIPFYGPTSHWMRKRSERRSEDERFRRSLARRPRTDNVPRQDFEPIYHVRFDALCTVQTGDCPRRLRFDLATYMALRR